MQLRRIAPVALPVVFAVFPLLSLFQQNETDVELGVLWWPLLVCVAVGAGLYGLFLLIFRDGLKAAAVASLVVVAFFYFGIFASKISLSQWWFFALWVVLFATGLVVLVRTTRGFRELALVLGVAAAVLVLPPLIRIAVYQANHTETSASDPRLWPDRLATPTQPGARPDIYVLIPDDYARSDVLARFFHYDDSWFTQALARRGFVFAKQSRSPYSDSEMNIAAAVNMDYLNGLGRILGAKSQDVRAVRRLIADNRAARLLKPLGYRYVHLDTDEVTFPVTNPDVSTLSVPDSFANLWLQKSVLRLAGFSDGAIHDRFRHAIRSQFSKLGDVAREPGPKFVVFHTLLPHDPYIFGQQGESVTFPYHTDESLGSSVGMQYYVRQLRFLSHKLLDAMDAILAASKTPPVIVIQSDEGFQASSPPFSEGAMQQVRVKGLIALHLPGVKAHPPEKLNTVNTLRFVFNRYFGTHYPLLRSASYPEQDFPYQFQEMRVR